MAVLDSSPIKTLAGFKGTTIGEYTVGSAGELPANSELAGAGLKRSEYSYIPIGNGAQAISAITSGKVAGVAFPYPELVTYEAVAGLKFRYFWHPILKDIPDATFISSPATLQNKSPLVARFLRAIVKAAILVRENPQLAARYFVIGVGIEGHRRGDRAGSPRSRSPRRYRGVRSDEPTHRGTAVARNERAHEIPLR